MNHLTFDLVREGICWFASGCNMQVMLHLALLYPISATLLILLPLQQCPQRFVVEVRAIY